MQCNKIEISSWIDELKEKKYRTKDNIYLKIKVNFETNLEYFLLRTFHILIFQNDIYLTGVLF